MSSTSVNAPAPVTVIGLGPMGRTMAGVFLDRGHAVTVWNRTPSRAADLVERGAHLAANAEEALAASELVVLSLTDYDAMYALLGDVDPAALKGRVLVNLTSDTPDKAREAATWAAKRGATQLTGGVLTPPSGIGDPASTTLYSGPRDVFDAHRATLEVLSGADHRGEDPGLAALLYQLNMVMFWTALSGYWQALALAGAHGLTAADIRPLAVDALNLGQFVEFYTPRVDAGDHGGDVDRLSMAVASTEHVLHTAADAGLDTTVPEAVARIFRRAAEAGHAADSTSVLVEVLKRPAA
ncbi:NAD(P)-binding domain-containing protein [Streptomyces sp. TRM76323]|uniref:NAD(P)-binding domain-containing protein n=1 Tax=Streptomyces tamarix TaxID=3078565 RepID=A0ABU3QID0_9ACTN|nr:NAD(P)-binding domain-containing protein [Streptomyces tamarix]MDT9682516.1 NAD(P)-binding domain-containing protein [Streptomyces tamarix]